MASIRLDWPRHISQERHHAYPAIRRPIALARPQLLSDADRERLRRYAEMVDFYGGYQWTGRRQPGELRMTLNYARALVRKVSAYVFAAPVTFSVPAPGAVATANLAERVLQETAQQNDLSRLDADLATESAVLGDAAMKITWHESSGRPIVAAVDPATLIATTLPDNPRQMTEVSQIISLSGASLAALFGPLQAVDPAKHYTVIETWTDLQWRVIIDGQTVVEEANPYGWIPTSLWPTTRVLMPSGVSPISSI
ncbi:MAG: phage portal protein [Thermomicrobiales bacterium]